MIFRWGHPKITEGDFWGGDSLEGGIREVGFLGDFSARKRQRERREKNIKRIDTSIYF